MSETLHRKTRTGRIVSDKMDKTVVVMIEKKVMHPVYKKFITRRTKYKAHDELNAFQMDEVVEIEETRPLSRDKRWRVKRLIERIA
jgi:small subunit ribosomal protein S17